MTNKNLLIKPSLVHNGPSSNPYLKQLSQINDSLSHKLQQPNNIGCKQIPTSTAQFDKLLEITKKCADYYQTFSDQKANQLQILQRAFWQMRNKLNSAFKEIIDDAVCKNAELLQFLSKKHEQLVAQKTRQQEQLRGQLAEIKSVHLASLLRDSRAECSIETDELVQFAGSLNKFYEIMAEIQRNSYEENVDQCISFINNLVNQEIRNTVEDKIPQRIEDLLNFSFNNSQMECGKMSNNDNHNTSGKNKEQDGQLLEPLWGKFNDVEEVRRQLEKIAEEQRQRRKRVAMYNAQLKR